MATIAAFIVASLLLRTPEESGATEGDAPGAGTGRINLTISTLVRVASVRNGPLVTCLGQIYVAAAKVARPAPTGPSQILGFVALPDESARAMSPDDVRAVLTHGELSIEGRLIDASNTTLYAQACLDAVELTCVYKPVAGERPLWDFPDGTLAGREVAACLVSDAMGWGVVPPTVMRDGPLGPGMCQLWIDVDEHVDLIALLHGDDPALRRIAVFDAVVNNADRKGGHLLPTPDGHIFGVDHGVCFSTDDKLRTILWQWRGTPLPDDAIAALTDLRDVLVTRLGEELREHLTSREVAATRRRVDRLLRTRCFPQPSEGWPAVPWPPF